MKNTFKRILNVTSLGIFAALSTHVYAAGFRMEFQSSSILADAGDAAVVEDAGTNWYNSAGLVYLPQQFVMSSMNVYAPARFTGTAFAPSALPPPIGIDFSAFGHANSHADVILPAIHYSLPLTNCLAFGLSVVPAWGLLEDYNNDSIVRYDLKRVFTQSIDIAPSLAVKFNNHWSVGVGPNFDYWSVLTRYHVRTEGLLIPPATPIDSITRFFGKEWTTGGHAGILYSINDCTRIGLNYRSKMIKHLHGDSYFRLGDFERFDSGTFKLRVPLPATTSLSIYHDFNDCWAMMGTITYDQWNVLTRLIAKNLPSPLGNIPFIEVPQHMRNTIDFGIGTHYKLSDRLMLRANMKYEPTPTRDQFRDINFPDGDKLGFQIGSRIAITKCVAVDLLYGHVFVRRVEINGFNPVTLAKTTGHSRTTVDIIGGQIVWNV